MTLIALLAHHHPLRCSLGHMMLYILCSLTVWSVPSSTRASASSRSFLFPKASQMDPRKLYMWQIVPFSDGIRGCLGKKFALVELCSLITRIFSEYTVELATNGIPEEQDDGTNVMTLCREARERAELQLSAGLEFKVSLRLLNLHVYIHSPFHCLSPTTKSGLPLFRSVTTDIPPKSKAWSDLVYPK